MIKQYKCKIVDDIRWACLYWRPCILLSFAPQDWRHMSLLSDSHVLAQHNPSPGLLDTPLPSIPCARGFASLRPTIPCAPVLALLLPPIPCTLMSRSCALLSLAPLDWGSCALFVPLDWRLCSLLSLAPWIGALAPPIPWALALLLSPIP